MLSVIIFAALGEPALANEGATRPTAPVYVGSAAFAAHLQQGRTEGTNQAGSALPSAASLVTGYGGRTAHRLYVPKRWTMSAEVLVTPLTSNAELPLFAEGLATFGLAHGWRSTVINPDKPDDPRSSVHAVGGSVGPAVRTGVDWDRQTAFGVQLAVEGMHVLASKTHPVRPGTTTTVTWRVGRMVGLSRREWVLSGSVALGRVVFASRLLVDGREGWMWMPSVGLQLYRTRDVGHVP